MWRGSRCIVSSSWMTELLTLCSMLILNTSWRWLWNRSVRHYPQLGPSGEGRTNCTASPPSAVLASLPVQTFATDTLTRPSDAETHREIVHRNMFSSNLQQRTAKLKEWSLLAHVKTSGSLPQKAGKRTKNGEKTLSQSPVCADSLSSRSAELRLTFYIFHWITPHMKFTLNSLKS